MKLPIITGLEIKADEVEDIFILERVGSIGSFSISGYEKVGNKLNYGMLFYKTVHTE